MEILLVDGGFNQKGMSYQKIKAQKANSSLFAFFVPFFSQEGKERRKMNISTFYQHCRCEKIATMQHLLQEESRYPLLDQAIKSALVSLNAGVHPDTICAQTYLQLKDSYSKLEQTFSWKATGDAKNDALKLGRFFKWFRESNMSILKLFQSVKAQTPTPLFDGSRELCGKVDLICSRKEEGKDTFYGFILHAGQARKGTKGRSLSTNIATDLAPLVAKLDLEEQYPGIIICMVYLSREADTQDCIHPDFLVGQSASVNMFQLSYSDYYQKGVFEHAKMQNTFLKVLSEQSKGQCSDCSYYELCKSPSFTPPDNTEETPVETSGYRIPTFTEDQIQVVQHVDGPLRVCAGPGSGKTATLIGRIQYLVEKVGIDPAFLLVVTFTNEAAAELKKRCLSFLDEEHLPKIATLNSFCYGILRDNCDLLGKTLKLLGTIERLRLIENIVSVFPPLKGFKYGQEYGNTGLYKTIANRLDYFFSSTPEGFFNKYPELGNDFVTFANQYHDIVEMNGYISFDEQISLTNKLFADYPEVLGIYQSIYKYIMVDEFQDCCREQVSMLYALSAKHRNLVVVGDDDQSIYGFRNAKSEYMIDFEKSFADAKTVVLRKNFRSTSTLVEASKSLIRNNRNRIEKEIVSGKPKSESEKVPTLIRDISAGTIDRVIEMLISAGYRYEDIAVLSTKNALLERLHNEMRSPSVLSKSYLRVDGLFLLLSVVMRLYRNLNDDRAFYQYLKLYRKEHLVQRKPNLSLSESVLEAYGISDAGAILNGTANLSDCPIGEELLQLFGNFFVLLEHSEEPRDFIQKMNLAVDWKTSNSSEVMCNALELNDIHSMEAFYEYLSNVSTFEDDTRVEEHRGNRILLSTSHDAKGKEFRVVLLLNDFSKNSEETRRLFYVAMTRAKEQLFILQDDKKEVDYLGEIPYEELSWNEEEM